GGAAVVIGTMLNPLAAIILLCGLLVMDTACWFALARIRILPKMSAASLVLTAVLLWPTTRGLRALASPDCDRASSSHCVRSAGQLTTSVSGPGAVSAFCVTARIRWASGDTSYVDLGPIATSLNRGFTSPTSIRSRRNVTAADISRLLGASR